MKSSVINRFFMNRMGDRGFKIIANYWMRNQTKTGDGLKFMKRLYSPGIIRKLIWPIAKFSMLRKIKSGDGRTIHRMPFRKSLKRDEWEPSNRAMEIGEEWKNIQKGGGKVSFKEE